jgi:hypothetical protein
MKTIFEVVLNTATSESPSVVWTKFMAMCSHAWSKLSYEVSLRSSSAPRSSFLFGNSLVKLIDLHGKFFSAKTNPSEATGDSHRSLSSSTLRSSEDSYIGGDLNVWSMFGIVIGAIVVLACFYYVVNVSSFNIPPTMFAH